MRRRNYQQLYYENQRMQRAELTDFINRNKEDAENLLYLYKYHKRDIPDNEYRAMAFFINDEYADKPLSLVALYNAEIKYLAGYPKLTRELVIPRMCYKFRMYTKLLEEGGY